jgi:hypothetical protein
MRAARSRFDCDGQQHAFSYRKSRAAHPTSEVVAIRFNASMRA